MSNSYLNTWDGVKQAAADAGAKYPELVAAQWALESARGKSTSGKNNYFGIKGEGTKRRTKEFVGGKEVTVTAEFQDFADLGECVAWLVDRWYKDYEEYQGVNRAADRNAAAWGLVRQGYATDPAYAEKLIGLMTDQEGGGAPAPGARSGKKGADALLRLVATQATWLKKRPVQAAELEDDERVAVAEGHTYAVSAYRERAADAHAQVELSDEAGTWFIFEPHWRREQRSGEALTASVNWEDFGCLVTPNLTVGEILQFDRRRIPPTGSAVRNRLLVTAAQFQKVRDAWGQPLGVTSFYRPEPINREVGGVSGSRHTTGEAFDVYPTTRSLESFYQWVRVRWTGGLGDGRSRGFVHLDTRGNGGFVPGAGVRPTAEWLY